MVRFHFDRSDFTVEVIEQDDHFLLDFDTSYTFESNKNRKILEKYKARSFDELILDVEWSLNNIKNSMESEAYNYGGGIFYKFEVEEISWNQKRIRYILKAAQLKKNESIEVNKFKEESQKVKNKIDYLNDLREIANSKGGNCLSEEYKNNKSKLEFVCNKGHHWQATPNNIKDGTWCPECYLNKEGYLNEIQDIAKSHGGRCLSKEYINAHTHLEF
ncbi:MAG: hypothetical protein EU533_02460, partial [Promethearchaeota archaeon]